MLIQINISDENSKSGIPLAELDALAAEVAALPRITLRGLMAIPAPESDYVRQFEVAQQMAVAFAGLKTRYPSIDTLSLGMSDDMDAAIAAGSTMVRIGTAILVLVITLKIRKTKEHHEYVDLPALNGN